MGSQVPIVVKDGVFTVAKPTVTSASLQSTKVVCTAPNTTVAAMQFPYYMASLQKITHPVLVTSLMAPAVGIQTSLSSSSVTGTSAGSAVMSPATFATFKSDVKLEPSTGKPQSVIPISYNNSSVSLIANPVTLTNVKPLTSLMTLSVPSTAPKTVKTLSTTSANVTSSVPVRHVLTPSLLPGQLAWPHFLTIPRQPVMVSSGAATPTATQSSIAMATTSTSQVTSHPYVSLANLNQLTHMMAPMTVMSPGIPVTPGGAITQAQLNGVFATPLIKQLQFPLLQSAQMLGQQVMKPVVVVSVPSVISSSSLNNSSTVVATTSK